MDTASPIDWSQYTRCDLNGLLIDGKKYHVNLQEEYDVERQESIARRLRLPTETQRNRFAASTVALFAWHKTLNVFAGGEATALLTNTSASETKDATHCISIIEHSAHGAGSCQDALAATESGFRMCSECRTSLVDSVITFGDASNRGMGAFHPLTVHFQSDDDYTLEYAAELFASNLMEAFCDTFEMIYTTAISDPTRHLADLQFTTPLQDQQLDQWNATDGDWDRTARLNNLIERSCERTPDNTAVVYKDRALSFRQLNERANRLAHYLRDRVGVVDEQLIGLFLPKSELLIVVVLGIWKAGAAYSPIDTTYPDERATFSLVDTRTKLLITTQAHADRATRLADGMPGVQILVLESILQAISLDQDRWPGTNPTLKLDSNSLCYLTYTSGTTGQPKGIRKRHSALVNSITDIADRYEVKHEREAVVLFSPYVFEPFARQTLIALANSQTLVVVDDDEKLDPVAFEEILSRERVTYLNGTASVLLEYNYSRCPDLKRLVLVGEDLTQTRYRALRKKFKKRIISEYGFTESAFVTAIKIFEPDSTRPNRSIGRPLRNVKCYVLDNNLKRLPPGAIGGLYIGGLGIAEGYWNRPELSAERFLPNPFQTESEKLEGRNSTIYYTGDLARILPGINEVEYCGRSDFQLKLRGVRVEPAEIEAVLCTYETVERAVVVAKAAADTVDDGAAPTMHLIAYWVGQDTDESVLISFLEKKLPRYMVPTRVINLSRIPVTINGKIDFRALPAVDLTPATSTVRVPPSNRIQKALCEIWAELLSIRESSFGISDSFFRLGGNSIVALQLVGRIRRQLQYRITVEQIFATRTIQKMEHEMRPETTVTDQTTAVSSLSPASIGIEDPHCLVYPANSLQQGFVYHSLKNGGHDAAYTMQTVCTYKRDLEVLRYRDAWKHVQDQSPTLRLRLVSRSQIYQVIYRDSALDFHFVEGGLAAGMDSLMQEDLIKPYDLEKGPLFRVYLVPFSQHKYKMLFSAHHAILDGWSIPILLDRVHQTYLDGKDALCSQEGDAYGLSQQVGAEMREQNLAYWRGEVESVSERCDLRGLMLDSVRYKVNLSAYDSIQEQREKSLDLSDTWSNLQAACSKHDIMLHTVLQFAAHKVLQAYGNGKQSVVGTIVSGRDLPVDGIENALGLFINTLPLVINHEDLHAETVLQGLERVQRKAVAMNMRSTVELGKLTPGKMAHELFDCLLVLENYPALDRTNRRRLAQALQTDIQGTSEKLSYPLCFVCTQDEENSGLTVTIRYAAELFSEETIADILDVFDSVFGQIVQKLHEPVTTLEFLGDRQLSRLAGWNQSDVPYPRKTLDALFEEVVEEFPSKTAVVYENGRLTYAELNAKANQLARLLRAEVHAEPDRKVALFLEKNLDMFVALLGVWKAGMAYVPIDPSFPAERVSYILQDTEAAAVIAKESLIDRLQDVDTTQAPVLPLEATIRRASTYSTANLEPITSCTDLAYVYFTSGTTGKPKGVMIEHFGVVNLQRSLCKTFGLRDTPDEVLLSFSNYTFDHFVEQMTDALLTGQTLLVLNDDMRADKDRLYAYITQNRVTYLSGTPSVISMYDYDKFPWMRRIDCVGEDFSEPVFNKIRAGFDGIIINGYGPTETSITTHKRLYTKGERRMNKSIGLQIDNSRTYVLNSDMKQVPIGAIGELFLGGNGVGRGYLNRPDLTVERFPPNPYQSEQDRQIGRDARLYKTGDLARWLPNGEIEYLGRTDFQIKLRGQRVELGEIESAITSCADIVQSVVVPQSRVIGDAVVATKYLVGYFVSNTRRTEIDVKNELRMKLPEHLIPNRVVQIDSIPVTVSGKLDSKKLPTVDYSTGNTRVEPANDTEAELSRIWGKILGLPVEEISVVEHFVTLGGDSLLSTKLSFEMTQKFRRRITVADIFKHRTVRSLATLIRDGAPVPDPVYSTLKETRSGPARASLAQERLLFIDSFLGGTNVYNVLKYLVLPEKTSVKALRRATASVFHRHEALRTHLVPDPATKLTLAKIVPPSMVSEGSIPLDHIRVQTQKELDEFLDVEAQHTFDLQRQFPARLALVEVTEPEIEVLAWNIHHTALDAWSWSILLRDLIALYKTEVSNPPQDILPDLTYSQAAYSELQRKELQSKRGVQLKEYWTRQMADFATLDLPTDHARPTAFDHRGDDLQVVLDPRTLDRTNSLARTHGVTPFVVFCTVYCLLLRTYTNQDDIVMGLPVANREDAQLQDVVGCFMNMVVLRVQVDAKLSVRELLQHVQQEVQNAHAHQDYPFEELVRALEIENSPDRHPVFHHVFSSDIVSSVSASAHANGDSGAHWEPQEYKPAHAVYSSAKVDLSTSVSTSGGNTVINFNFPTALFRRETVQRYADSYQTILGQIIAPHSKRSGLVKDLLLVSPLLLDTTPTEQATNGAKTSNGVLTNGNTNGYHPKTNGHSDVSSLSSDLIGTLGQLFDSCSRANPNACAVTTPDESITYAELRERSARLANFLYERHLGSSRFIGLMFHPSIDMIVSVLALWQLGIGYVPLDLRAPEERLRTMLEETRPAAILSHTIHKARLQGVGMKNLSLVLLDEASATAELRASSSEISCSNASPGAMAYCIFTSGSTGKPKGCLVSQRAVLCFMKGVQERYFATVEDIKSVLMVSSYVFDFSVEQFALSFMAGRELVLLPNGITSSMAFYRYINRDGLYISGTPSLLAQLDFSRLPGLRMITAAGEQLHAAQYDRMREGFSGPINNAYGCTESTVYNLVKTFQSPAASFVNSLGDSLPRQKAYVVNNSLQLLPTGAVGELVLAGHCITDGYLDRPELNNERFVPNPFCQDPSFATLYRTGDIVRRLPNGNLEFKGRRDAQIKIRGFRIELEEIQATISNHQDVNTCVVLPKSHEQGVSGRADFLVAYFTSAVDITAMDLEAFLAQRLPEPFIPSHFVRVPGHLPTTVTGKLDIARLPAIDQETQQRVSSRSPRTPEEIAMCNLWSAVLGTEVGLDDDFFRSGGDSIMSLMVSRDAHERCGVHVSVKDIFEHRTVARVLRSLENEKPTYKAEQGCLEGPMALLPIQRWFFAKDLTRPNHWNQTFVIRTPSLNVARLQNALQKLRAHHDALRMTFTKRKDEIVQRYSSSQDPVELHVIRSRSNADVVRKLDQLQQTLDIGTRLWVVAYIQEDGEDKATVWFAAHHLIIDTETWRILARDLQTLYDGQRLPDKTSSFRQWAEGVGFYAMTETERRYWDSVSNVASKLSLPFGPRCPTSSTTLSMSNEDTFVVSKPHLLGVTAQDVILTAFSRAVYDWASTPLAITMEGHGRDGLDNLDVSRTAGWFTTMYPFIVPYTEDLLAHMCSVSEARDDIPNKAIGFGPAYGYADLPLVSFNYLGKIMISSGNSTAWRLESAMDGAKWGRSRGDGHNNANSSVLDVTAWVEDDSLTVQLDGLVEPSILQQLSTSIEKHLSTTVDLLRNNTTQSQIPEDFVPFFEFADPPRQRPTLFLFPPGEGGAESYFHNLVTALDDVHLVAFNNIHLEHPHPGARFEALAAQYISWMRTVQPTGPYHLLGWSFGGVLGLEIALQLTAAGEAVASLGMIDSYFDVARVSDVIGCGGQREILDPINWHYHPDRAGLDRLAERVSRIALFKAGEPNEKPRNEEQVKLFGWYDESGMNGLDALLSEGVVERVVLEGNTHYSWVRDPVAVDTIARAMRGHLKGN